MFYLLISFKNTTRRGRLKFRDLDSVYEYLSTIEWDRFTLHSELPLNFSDSEFHITP